VTFPSWSIGGRELITWTTRVAFWDLLSGSKNNAFHRIKYTTLYLPKGTVVVERETTLHATELYFLFWKNFLVFKPRLCPLAWVELQYKTAAVTLHLVDCDNVALRVTHSMQHDGCWLLQVNDISMENTVHEHAVATLKAAKDRVVLLVGKPVQDASPFHTRKFWLDLSFFRSLFWMILLLVTHWLACQPEARHLHTLWDHGYETNALYCMLFNKSRMPAPFFVTAVSVIAFWLQCVTCAAVGRDESFDSLARHDTTTLQRAVMSPVQMPRPQQQQQQQQQLASLLRQAPDSNVTR